MSESEMPRFGVWERAGDVPFALNTNLPAILYRWHPPKRFGDFVVEFQCTEARPHRRFYPVEVLEAVSRDEPADDFVARMCRLGIEMLPELEALLQPLQETSDGSGAGREKLMPDREALETTYALFETRRTGHSRVTRSFHRADDFDDTTRSRYRPEHLIPEIKFSKRKPGTRRTGMDLVREVQQAYAPPASTLPGAVPGREIRLDERPLRTPLDQVLVQGVFRAVDGTKVLGFREITNIIAPALVAGIDVEGDSEFLEENIADFRHFLNRLAQKYRSNPGQFGTWVRTEREKGFTRLLPGWKNFGPEERQAAGEKGKRFYRRVLWTAHESMSRCYGAVALWMWMAFCEAKTVINAAPEEERAFRWYQSPLVCTAGMPLWFFGPNVLRWVLEPFIERVWGLRPDQDFDSLTQLIGLYGRAASDRRSIDANKKRSASSKRTAPQAPTASEAVYEETDNGSNRVTQVPVSFPEAIADETPAEYTTFQRCSRCEGSLHPVRHGPNQDIVPFTVEGGWICQRVECVECGKELVFRTPHPG